MAKCLVADDSKIIRMLFAKIMGNLGFDVTIATDAVGSSAREAHEATLRLIYPRCEDQIRLLTTDEILAGR